MKENDESENILARQIVQSTKNNKHYLLTTFNEGSQVNQQVKKNGDRDFTWNIKDFGTKPRKISPTGLEIETCKLYRPATSRIDGYHQMPRRSVVPYTSLAEVQKQFNFREGLHVTNKARNATKMMA